MIGGKVYQIKFFSWIDSFQALYAKARASAGGFASTRGSSAAAAHAAAATPSVASVRAQVSGSSHAPEAPSGVSCVNASSVGRAAQISVGDDGVVKATRTGPRTTVSWTGQLPSPKEEGLKGN